MKIKSHNYLLLLALAVSLQNASATDLHWNPSPLTNDWDAGIKWSLSAGGSLSDAWVDGNSALFDQAGPYSVNITAARIADAVNVSVGNVTLTGSAVASNSVSIASGATLNTSGDRIAKAGTTPVTVDGTLDLTVGGLAGGHYIQLGGTGNVITGTLRHSGSATFGGNIQDVSAANRAAIAWNGGVTGTLTLSGNNSGMTGDLLMSLANSLLIANSANAISHDCYLRLEGTANALLVELANGDLTRVWATGSNTNNGATGGIRWSGSNSGFYPTGADRNLTFVNALNDNTPANVVWGLNGLDATTVVLGATAATNTITWTNDIDLAAGNRTFKIGNGAADVDAALSGVISGLTTSKLTKSGTGTLLLSNANSHAGGTAIADSQSVDSVLRITNSSALGIGALTIGGGGNLDQSRLEISGGLTITNAITGFASRNNNAPNIVSLSGDNIISGNMSSGGGGSSTTFQSDSGKLTFTGSFNGRQINLTGDGNGQFSNNVFALGTYGLVKSGTGTWTLKGTANYSGTTTITEGSLVAQKTTQLAIGTGDVSVSSGANLTITDHAGGGQLAYANNITLEGTGITGKGVLGFYNSGGFDMSGAITISGGVTLRTDPNTQTTSSTVTFTNAISGADGLTLMAQGSVASGTPRFTFTGASSYTGATLLTSSGSNTAPFTVTLSGGSNRLPVGTSLIFGGTPAGSPTGTFDKSTRLALDGISQEIASISNANAGNYHVVGANTTAATLMVNNPSDATFDGIIGGAGTNENNLGVAKYGAGTLTLSGANTYTGDTTVMEGELSLSATSLGNRSTVSIGPGMASKGGASERSGSSTAVLHLPDNVTYVVASLVIDGFVKPAGVTYDENNSDGAITGPGKIQVIVPADNYASWATDNGIPGQPATGDFDKDGLSNLVEYGLGLDPTKSSVPAGTFNGTNLSFTKGADAIANGDVNFVIEESDDLGVTDLWTPVVTQNAPDSSLTISYTLPTGKTKIFTRLKVTQIP